MRTLSLDFRSAIFSQESDEVPIFLVTIEHESLEDPIRLTSDPTVRLTGPGSFEETPWTPEELGADVLGWFDASEPSTVTITGLGVSAWATRAGTMTATQATDADRPQYTSGQYVEMDDEADFDHLDVANCPDAYDYLVVGTPSGANGSGGVGYRVWFTSPSNRFTLLTEGIADGNPSNDLGVFVDSGGFKQAGALQWTTDEKAFVYGTVPTASDVQIAKNGGTFQNTSSGDMGDTTIVEFGRSTFRQGPGKIHEIFILTQGIFSTVPTGQTATVKELLEGYVAHKHGIEAELPVDHPFKAAAPTVVIAAGDETAEITYGTISRGETYLFVGMHCMLPDERERTPPQTSLVISNTGRELIPLARSVVTPPPTAKIEVVLASDPDTVEFDLPPLYMVNCDYTAAELTFQLTMDSLAREPYPADSFDPARFPGLF